MNQAGYHPACRPRILAAGRPGKFCKENSMSCPVLRVHIAGNIRAGAITDFLGIEVLHPAESEAVSCVGNIRIWSSVPHNYQVNPLYKNLSWALTLNFATSYNWSKIRASLALELCAALEQEGITSFMGEFDTGETLFFINEGVLFISEADRDYYSRFPHSFEKLEFAELPEFHL